MDFNPDSISDIDVFRDEYDQFQWDVHILIEGTLQAGMKYLGSDMKLELANIDEWMKGPISDAYHQHLVDQYVDALETNARQDRFLRNMALVALSSRLTHALRAMARHAELFSPRKKRYKGASEFDSLWAEYSEQFGMDFKTNAHRIAFVETMRVVRNQIVHDGSEANPLKPFDESDLRSGDSGYLNTHFSDNYPEFVYGEGIGAEVTVSEAQLHSFIESSVDLVGWLAEELRAREIAGRQNPNAQI